MISVTCPSCNQRFEFLDLYAGMTMVCRQCRHGIAVPKAGASAAVPTRDEAPAGVAPASPQPISEATTPAPAAAAPPEEKASAAPILVTPLAIQPPAAAPPAVEVTTLSRADVEAALDKPRKPRRHGVEIMLGCTILLVVVGFCVAAPFLFFGDEVSAWASRVVGRKQKDGRGRAFLDVKQKVPSRLEFNQQIAAKKPGNVGFRVASAEGPFSVVWVSEKTWQALQGRERKIAKEEVLFFRESNGEPIEGSVPITAGNWWVIIENRAAKETEFQLQCFEP